MAIDTSAKRRAASRVGKPWMGKAIEPSFVPDSFWRSVVAWSYEMAGGLGFPTFLGTINDQIYQYTQWAYGGLDMASGIKYDLDNVGTGDYTARFKDLMDRADG